MSQTPRRIRILFLAPRLPWPLDTGGKIRTYQLLRVLARHHDVRLLTFDGPETGQGGLQAVRELSVACDLVPAAGPLQRVLQVARGLAGPMPVNIRKYHNPALARRVAELAKSGQVDLVHCDHLHMAPYGPASGLPFVLDEHNVETLIWQRFAQDRTEPLHRRLLFQQQSLLLGLLESRLASRAALVLLCSEADEKELGALLDRFRGGLLGRALGGGGPGVACPGTRVVPNGVDLAYFSQEGPSELAGHVFFTGSMDWAPNENALLAFLQEIWPAMRQSLPGLTFAAVGRNPGPRLLAWQGRDGVQVTGTVPDVRPYMRRALALLVPMRVGGGTRLKILEAFAAKVPVISTALGIEGIEATPGLHYLRAETPAEFAAAAQNLQQDAGLRQALVQEAFDLAQKRYTWDAIGEGLAQEYAARFAPAG